MKFVTNTFYLLLFSCLHPLYLGLSLDLFGFLLYWIGFLLLLLCILPLCSVLLLSMLSVLLFFYTILPHILLLAMHFSLGMLYFSPTPFLLLFSASGSCLILSLSLATCHDLAKRLSHYLYFFSFLFLFFLIGLITTRWSAGKSHMTLSQYHNSVMDGHRWSCHGSQSQCVTWLE